MMIQYLRTLWLRIEQKPKTILFKRTSILTVDEVVEDHLSQNNERYRVHIIRGKQFAEVSTLHIMSSRWTWKTSG